MVTLQLCREPACLTQPGLRVGVREDPGETLVERLAAGDRQVVGDVASLVQVMPISA